MPHCTFDVWFKDRKSERWSERRGQGDGARVRQRGRERLVADMRIVFRGRPVGQSSRQPTFVSQPNPRPHSHTTPVTAGRHSEAAQVSANRNTTQATGGTHSNTNLVIAEETPYACSSFNIYPNVIFCNGSICFVLKCIECAATALMNLHR